MTLERQLYKVVRGKDSPIEIPLLEAGAISESTEITRCDLTFRRDGVADITFSSDNDPSWFTLQDPESVDGQIKNIIEINLRQIPTPPANGRYEVDVYLWDSEYTNGRLWGTIDIEILAAPPAAA